MLLVKIVIADHSLMFIQSNEYYQPKQCSHFAQWTDFFPAMMFARNIVALIYSTLR